MSTVGEPLGADPTRRVVTVRNWRRIKVGIAIAALALVVLLVGALLQVGVIGSQVLRPTARGDVGETVSFEAEARRYDLILVRPDTVIFDEFERIVGRTECQITLGDGSAATVDGGRQAISTETGLGATIGWFDAVAGPTTVRCDNNSVEGVLIGGYTVAESRERLTVLSLAMIVGGILLGIAAALVINSGVRGKAVMTNT